MGYVFFFFIKVFNRKKKLFFFLKVYVLIIILYPVCFECVRVFLNLFHNLTIDSHAIDYIILTKPYQPIRLHILSSLALIYISLSSCTFILGTACAIKPYMPYYAINNTEAKISCILLYLLSQYSKIFYSYFDFTRTLF